MMAGKKRELYSLEDYGSEFEYDGEKKKKRDDLMTSSGPAAADRPHKSEYVEERCRDEARYMRHHHVSTNAYERHKELVNNYMMYYGGKIEDFTSSSVKRTDLDIVRENHQFVWTEGEDNNWDKQLAKTYYDKLYKEYCLADLSLYKHNKIAMRWRTRTEVINGKGQFTCGNKKCQIEDGLNSWEVNFSYTEHAVKKNALVKLRLCEKCSDKLNYKTRRRKVDKLKDRDESLSEKNSDSVSSHKHKNKHKVDEIVDGLLF